MGSLPCMLPASPGLMNRDQQVTSSHALYFQKPLWIDPTTKVHTHQPRTMQAHSSCTNGYQSTHKETPYYLMPRFGYVWLSSLTIHFGSSCHPCRPTGRTGQPRAASSRIFFASIRAALGEKPATYRYKHPKDPRDTPSLASTSHKQRLPSFTHTQQRRTTCPPQTNNRPSFSLSKTSQGRWPKHVPLLIYLR
jgi:hypothetical protein